MTAQLNLSGIPETLLIPLWARASELHTPSPIIQDHKAAGLVGRINYNFAKFESARLSQVGVCVRSMLLDREAGSFLRVHPDAVVVNLGAGLDTRYFRIAAASHLWYELDVPEVIRLRRQYLPESKDYRYIEQSVFDDTWMDKIKARERPVLFIAEGLLMYFSQDQVRPLFEKLAARFPGSEMLFEMLCPYMVGRSRHNDSLKTMDRPPEFLWGMENARTICDWHPSIRFLQEWNYYDYHKKRWGIFGMIARLPVIRRRLACRIVHLRFEFNTSSGQFNTGGKGCQSCATRPASA